MAAFTRLIVGFFTKRDMPSKMRSIGHQLNSQGIAGIGTFRVSSKKTQPAVISAVPKYTEEVFTMAPARCDARIYRLSCRLVQRG